MFDQNRYEAEFKVLKSKLPDNAWTFRDLNGSRPHLAAAVKTRSGRLYTIQIELANFPNSVPKVFVTQMLRDCDGNEMRDGRHSSHTLPSEHGWTRICHYGPESWTPRVALYKIYVKCALWLNIYELHLKTHRPMEYYLKRQALNSQPRRKTMIEELSKEDADFARAFGEEVKKQGEGTSSKKLMFDPKTGQFAQASKMNPFAAGEVVTEMTEKGFAQ